MHPLICLSKVVPNGPKIRDKFPIAKSFDLFERAMVSEFMSLNEFRF